MILLEMNKQGTSPSLRSVRFPKPQIFVQMFRRNLQSSVWKRHVGAHQMSPIWRPENSVNIWNLLWLSRRLIISIEQTSIYVSTFPNALTFKKAQNHDKYLFSRNAIVDFVSRTSITTNFKLLWLPSVARY